MPSKSSTWIFDRDNVFVGMAYAGWFFLIVILSLPAVGRRSEGSAFDLSVELANTAGP
jgi:hypothetical protein